MQASSTSESLNSSSLADTWSLTTDLISLTKPRIMVLLLITTCCPMILAAGGIGLDMSVVFWALLGGALVSGSASAINCIYDQDIDSIMERTKTRPLPAGRIEPALAFAFSLVIGLLGLFVLQVFINSAAAAVALAGHLFYVFIYTMWLKRTTVQNIVIGGAAGAVPPMVGWVAVTGELNLTAWLLFGVIFLWTPPHFWALALNKNEDYQRAGVPMMPVVRGEQSTIIQMLWYSIALLPVCVFLVYSSPYLGWLSMLSFGLLNSIFIFKIYQLRKLTNQGSPQKSKKAWDVFGFSLIYLALLFALLVIDSTLV